MAERTFSEEVDDFFTMTWRLFKGKIVDQAYKVTPLWATLMENNRIVQRHRGGNAIEVEVRHAKQDQNTKWIGRLESVGKAEKQTHTLVEYKWKHLFTGVVRAFDDDQKNRGPAKMHDYAKRKLMGAKDDLVDALENASWQDDPTGNGILSLQTLIAEDPTTGTLGGINRANSAWARNQFEDFNGGGFTIATDLTDRMKKMFNNCGQYKGGSRRFPDLIMTDKATHEEFEGRAEALRQIEASTSIAASLGFGDLAFKGAPIVWAPQCPAGSMFFLNTEHLEFAADPFNYFDMRPWKEEIDSPDRVTQIGATCALMCDQFQKQGVLFNIQ